MSTGKCLVLLGISVMLAGAAPRAESVTWHGAWTLVSSTFPEQTVRVPDWTGELLVVDGRFSRVYRRRDGTDLVPYDFHHNQGSWSVADGTLTMTVEYSNYAPLEGAVFSNVVEVVGGKQLKIGGKGGLEEVWQRR